MISKFSILKLFLAFITLLLVGYVNINTSNNVENIDSRIEILNSDIDAEIINLSSKIREHNSVDLNFKGTNDFFIYEKSKLVRWSTNDYQFEPKTIFFNSKAKFIVDNEFGIFAICKKDILNHTIVISVPLLRRYPLTNEYVSNRLNKTVFSNVDGDLFVNEVEGAETLEVLPNQYLYLKVDNVSNDSVLNYIASIVLVVLIFFTISIHQETNISLDVFLVLILRLALLFIDNQYEHSELLLFSPSVFASSFIQPNLFQLIVNAILLYTLFFILVKSKYFRLRKNVLQLVYVFLALIIINDLLKHSILDFNPYNFVSGDASSIIISIVIFVNLSLIIIALEREGIQWSKPLLTIGLSLALLIWYFQGELSIVFIIICLVTLLKSDKRHAHRIALLSICICLLISYQQSEKAQHAKHTENYKLINNLVSGNDPYFEYLVNEVSEQIANDKILISKLKNPFYGSNQFINDKIEKVYLSKYFSGYDFDIQVVSIDQILREKQKLTLGEENYNITKRNYTDLYQIVQNKVFNKDYLKIVCFNDDRLVKNVSIRFKAKSNAEYSILPQLLLAENNASDLKELNYAILEEGEVVSKKGIFEDFNDEIFSNTNIKGTLDDYEVMSFPFGSKTILVAQKETYQTGFTNYLSLSLILALFIFILNALYENLLLKKWDSILYRLQFSFLLIVISSFIVVLVTVIRIVNNDYKDDIKHQNLSKATVIAENVKNLLLKNSSHKSIVDTEIDKLSKSFSSDINVFNSTGDLIISTLPELYGKKFISEKIPYEALNSEKVSINVEQIGNLKYQSAVSPIFVDNSCLGYITVPFFNSEDELREKVNSICFTTFKNSIVILLIVLLFAYYISKSIANPIIALTKRISLVSMDTDSEAIKWQRNDEIGGLVKTFNRMLLNLKESKERLRQKEKQEAWKEMAQQVAHEIKNPLTPMKLSLQFLNKKVDEGVDSEEVKKTSNALIEQIDALSDIASSFSEFATMPEYKLEEYNVSELLKSTISLYKDTAEIKSEIENNLIVKLDEKAFRGILSNLIINGIQSVDVNKTAKIEVKCAEKEEDVLISIADNGVGIPEENQNKVFIPNFSTKTMGSGVGLALAKQGVEQFGGIIWFETIINEGTTFYIELPLSK